MPDAHEPPASIGFTDYKRAVYRRYQHAPHLEALDALLEAVARYTETGGREGVGRAIITMPPRHGKSLTTSRLFPTWFLGRNPDKRIILVSYGADLAEKHSRVARNILKFPRYRELFPAVSLAEDSQSAAAWDIAGNDGGMDAVGIAGGVTGKGAHVLIIDDPIRNREQAESPTWRAKIWDGYTDDLSTRLEPAGAVIVMATRWHVDDLTGRLLAREPEKWHVLNLPALAEENDPLGRALDEPLWPDRYTQVELIDRRERNAYSFASLYQQRPIPREGGLFKYADIDGGRLASAPDLYRIVVAIDPAVTSTADSDETGISVAGAAMVDGVAHGFVLDDLTIKGSPAEWARRAIAGFYRYEADRVIGEVNNGGDMVGFTLGTVDPSVPYSAVRASRGKQTRAEPIAALYEQGRIHHVGVFPALEDQMCTWVPGSGDSPDRVDALVWGLSDLLLEDGSAGVGTMPDEVAYWRG